MVPDSRETSSGSAPASSSVCQGRSSSTCSTPSVARTATRMPLSSPAMAARYPAPDVRTHGPTTVSPVRARLLPGLPRLVDRYAADAGVAGAARVTAALVAGGSEVALERLPAGDAAELLQLAARLHDDGLGARAELTVPVDALGPAAAGTVAGQALECGLGVALEGTVTAVDALAARLPQARVVVPSGEPGAEARCRVLGDGPVRLV